MKRTFLLLLISIATYPAFGQHVNIKSNLLYDATATINLGLEVGLSKKTSLDISGNYNPWTFSDHRQWKNWMVQPELRYWLCEKFNGHFFGAHAIGGEYNFNKVKMPFGLWPDLDKYNYQGYFIGAGLSYGYQWIFGNHWGLEASLGLGYLYTQYDKYSCATCGTKVDSGHKNYLGPTKVGISLIYFIH